MEVSVEKRDKLYASGRKKYFERYRTAPSYCNFSPKFEELLKSPYLVSCGSNREGRSWESCLDFYNWEKLKWEGKAGVAFHHRLTPGIANLFNISNSKFGVVCNDPYLDSYVANYRQISISSSGTKEDFKVDYLHNGRCNDAVFDAQNGVVYSVGDDGQVSATVTKKKKKKKSIFSSKWILNRIALDKAGSKLLFLASTKGAIKCDLGTGKTVQEFEVGENVTVLGLGDGGEHGCVYVGGWDKFLRVLPKEDISKPNDSMKFEHKHPVSCVTPSGDENGLYTGDSFGNVYVWDVRSCKKPVLLLSSPQDYRGISQICRFGDDRVVVVHCECIVYDTEKWDCKGVMYPSQTANRVIFVEK